MGGENIGRMTIRYVTLDKKWKQPTTEWKWFISVGNVVHGTRTWNYVHSGANEPWSISNGVVEIMELKEIRFHKKKVHYKESRFLQRN